MRFLGVLVLLLSTSVAHADTCSLAPLTCQTGTNLQYVQVSSSCPRGGYSCAPDRQQTISGSSVLAHLPRISPSPSLGSRGDGVIAIQARLITLGYLASGSATGYFGPLTRAAVQALQRDRGIVSSGSEATTGYGAVGPRTNEALSSVNVDSTAISDTNETRIGALLAQVQSLRALLAQLTGGTPPLSPVSPNSTTSPASSPSPASSTSCSFNGQDIALGSSVLAYQLPSAPAGSQCASQTRTCSNGTLSGSYQYGSCSALGAASCAFNGQVVASGQSVIAYQTSFISTGQCISETRLCSNGMLSGSYQYRICTVGAPSACVSHEAQQVPFNVIDEGHVTADANHALCREFPFTATTDGEPRISSFSNVAPGVQKFWFAWANRCNGGAPGGHCTSTTGGNPPERVFEGKQYRFYFSTVEKANACTLAQLYGGFGSTGLAAATLGAVGMQPFAMMEGSVAPSMSTNNAAYYPGAAIAVSWVVNGANTNDWIAITPHEAPWTSALPNANTKGVGFFWIRSARTGTGILIAPSTPGTYDITYYISSTDGTLANSSELMRRSFTVLSTAEPATHASEASLGKFWDTCDVYLNGTARSLDGVMLDYEVQDNRTTAEAWAFLQPFADFIRQQGKLSIFYPNRLAERSGSSFAPSPVSQSNGIWDGGSSSIAPRILQSFDLVGIDASDLPPNNPIPASDLPGHLTAQVRAYGAFSAAQLRKVFIETQVGGTSQSQMQAIRQFVLTNALWGIDLWSNRADWSSYSSDGFARTRCFVYGHDCDAF